MQHLVAAQNMSEFLAYEERNSYLELRNAKIARNHARLSELGLISSNMGKRVVPENTDTKVSVKRAKSNTSEKVEPKRRSLRMKQVLVDHNIQPSRKPIEVEQLIKLKVLDSTITPKKRSTIAKNSAREMDLDVDRLLFGSSNEAGDPGAIGIPFHTDRKSVV